MNAPKRVEFVRIYGSKTIKFLSYLDDSLVHFLDILMKSILHIMMSVHTVQFDDEAVL